MSIRINAIIVALSIAATGAVSYASVPSYQDVLTHMPEKADRLPLPASHGTSYVIIQTQAEGMTIVSRIRVDDGSLERASDVQGMNSSQSFASASLLNSDT